MSGSHRTGKTPRRFPERTLRGIERHLKARERRRDALAEEARALRRLAQQVVQRIHREENVDVGLDRIRRDARTLARHAHGASGADERLAHDALQESAEALLLAAVVREEPVPVPGDLGIDPEPYLSGVADLSGELRRLVLARLSAGDLKGAERYLAEMEEVHSVLMRFETTRSILALKPKQDTSRALLERTRGEVTLARILARSQVPPSSRSEEP